MSDGRPNIFISGITEGSVAANCGRLRIGQQIVAVNVKNLVLSFGCSFEAEFAELF